MYKEYSAVIIILIPISTIDIFDQEKVEITTSNSPTRLIVGGSARLVRLANNHQEAIRGSSVCKPRAKIIVRL